MICDKCNHRLPDDSEFCQYCGKKIEAGFVTSTDMTSDEAVNTIIKRQTERTVKMMESNSQTQPNNEGDADFGLVPEKPIYTQAFMSVSGEKEYLNRLYTANGEEIKYKRLGSIGVEGVNGIVDIYETYLPSGDVYKRIYINMYGATTSTKAPQGFSLKGSKCSDEDDNLTLVKSSEDLNPSRKFILFTNITSVITTVVSICSIVLAINIQDIRRNYCENWNTTIVYSVLLLMFGLLLYFEINSVLKNKYKLVSLLSLFQLLALIITGVEGSIHSRGIWYSYDNYNLYINSDIISHLNTIFIFCTILNFIFAFLPLGIVILNKVNNNWHNSISYREKCYKRVAKMYSYLEKGIITEAEFEKIKRDILKYIE